MYVYFTSPASVDHGLGNRGSRLVSMVLINLLLTDTRSWQIAFTHPQRYEMQLH